MKLAKISAALLAAVFLLAAQNGAAKAATLTASYTGLVTSGTDPFNLFGLNGAPLVGQTYRAVYTVNLDAPTAIVSIVPGISQKLLPGSGGTSGWLLINGHTFSLSGAAGGQMDRSKKLFDYILNSTSEVENSPSGLNGFYLTSTVFSPVHAVFSDLQLQSPFQYSLVGGDFGSLSFSNFARGPALGPLHEVFRISGSAQTVRIGDEVILPTGVPEPATWAMMLMGFGVLGGAFRIRRQRVRLMPMSDS